MEDKKASSLLTLLLKHVIPLQTHVCAVPTGCSRQGDVQKQNLSNRAAIMIPVTRGVSINNQKFDWSAYNSGTIDSEGQ